MSDARQLAGTLTRDLVYPLIALNRPGIDGLRRCPRWVWDTSEAEDLASYADALPKLAGQGMRIPVAWAHRACASPWRRMARRCWARRPRRTGGAG